MAEEGFSEKKLLSTGDLIKETLRSIEKKHVELNAHTEETFAELRALISENLTELGRRSEIKEETFKTLRSIRSAKARWVWFVLFESGGAQRFTDLHSFIGGSKTTLSKNLKLLFDKGLVRMVGDRWQAVSPEWWSRKWTKPPKDLKRDPR